MNRVRLTAAIAAPVLVAAGVAVGLTVAAAPGSAPGPGQPAGTVAGAGAGSTFRFYQDMMTGLETGRGGGGPASTSTGSMMGASPGYGSMMGGLSYAAMMGASGYAWMVGTATAPGWMRGQALPGVVTGTGDGDATVTDPGTIMGRLFANAPGPRVSPAEADRLGSRVPAGSTVDAARNRLTLSGHSVHLVAVAGPVGGRDDTFRTAGLIDPTIVVSAGSRMSIEVVNADPDSTHGLTVSATGTGSVNMPMMAGGSAFPGSAVWLLGEPTTAGLHAGTMTFTATTAGTYQYLCPTPGHARSGMVGTFIVTA